MWCILLQMLSGVLASPIDKLITNAAEDSESNSFKLHVYLHITSHVFVVVVVVDVVVDGGGIQIYRTFCIAFLAVCFSHLF